MQLNVIVFCLLLEFLTLEKIYSVPLQTVNKGILINELIRYYEPAMYTPEEIQHFHNRRRREVGGIPFNKPLKISFRAHDRNFKLILRTDDRIFANDVVFDSTSRTVNYDTQRVYTGVLEGEEDSLVQGVVTKEGFFDGTIFSKNEIFYVEPVSRYTPSSHQHQNLTSLPKHVHTIIYKTTDVKIPPSLHNPCASQILYLSRTKNELNALRTRRSLSFEIDVFRTANNFMNLLLINNSNASDQRNSVIPHHKRRSTKNGVSSLPIVSSHNEIIESNILKTYLNSQSDNRTRKKVNDSFVLKYPKKSREMKILLNNNMINRPRVLLNKTLSEPRQPLDRYQDFDVLPNGTLKHVIKRATVDPKKTTCMLYLQADHLFFQKYGTEEACIEVMTRHVQRVNSIYKNTDFNQDGKSDNISFMIKRIKVHTSESSKDSSYRFPGNYGVEKFLELFSEEDYDAFCLAYMFTYRDFEMGTLGLAWTGDLKNAGGVCEKNGHYRGSLKSLNTGIVTLLNYGKHVPPAVSHVTLAHEIGHNFGSPHDPESCTPGGEDGNYIMFARATSGDKKNNNKFSPCSLNSINPVLNSKARSQMGCFTEPQIAICGNGVVEAGEDCDCGWEEDCRDSCCYPQRRYPPTGEPPCKLTPNSICSPSQGPCCTSECQLKFGDKCRDDNGCRDSSYCDGRSPSCPPSVNKPNKTICNDEFVCFMGECTGSICLAYGLESCQCIPGPKDSLTKACELCCKKPGDDQPCISSFEWNESPFDVPDMFSKPGTPCNDYNGYCDVFQKCREVDPSGPLATLRKLLLSEESLASFKRWVTEHWYAVVIIVISIIFLLVLSTKLLGKHQGAKLKLVTIIHSSTAEAVRLPSDGDAGLTVHPPAVRNKLPLHRKVREKKLHTRVVNKKKTKESETNANKKDKVNNDKPASKSKTAVQKQNPENSETSNKRKTSKDNSRTTEYTREASQESGKFQRSKTCRPITSERMKAARKYRKHKSVEEPAKGGMEEPSARPSVELNSKEESEMSNSKSDLVNLTPTVTSKIEHIYENVENKQETGHCSGSAAADEKVKGSRSKRANQTSLEVAEASKKPKEDASEKKENKTPVKVTPKKISRPKIPSKKKKNKAEVIEYNNEVMQATSAKTTSIPSEDPLGKVQNWLMHSISVGKTSENFGIMTLTLPKSKSSPVGFSGNSKANEAQVKINSPPKIVHKNDKVVQIPKLSQKRSRSTGNLKKTEKKDEKMKLQVVYKPPFKFSVKLRNNRILGAVGTKILEEKANSNHLNRKNTVGVNGKIQRAAVLVRTTKRNSKLKQEKKSKNSPQVTSPEKENATENPFTFPSGVAPMSLVSVNNKQLPIYLTDQVDIDSNVHTVPSDLDVLLSEIMVAQRLKENLPDFTYLKIAKKPEDWDKWLYKICKENEWNHIKCPLIWREISIKQGKKDFIGGINKFLDLCYDYYGIPQDILSAEHFNKAEMNWFTKRTESEYFENFKAEAKKRKRYRSRQVCITGASSPMAEVIVMELLQIDLQKREDGLEIRLFDQSRKEYKLEEKAFDGKHCPGPCGFGNCRVVASMKEAFTNVDLVIVLDCFSRRTKESLVKWLKRNRNAMCTLGKALNLYAPTHCRVIIGSPSTQPICYNATVLASFAKKLHVRNIVAVTQDLGREALRLFASKSNTPLSNFYCPPVWGFIGLNKYVDIRRTLQTCIYKVPGKRANSTLPQGTEEYELRTSEYLINEQESDELLSMISQHKVYTLSQLGRWPCFAKATAVIDLLKVWGLKQEDGNGEILCLGVYSDGTFNIPRGIYWSQPVILKNGFWVPFADFPIPRSPSFNIYYLFLFSITALYRTKVKPRIYIPPKYNPESKEKKKFNFEEIAEEVGMPVIRTDAECVTYLKFLSKKELGLDLDKVIESIEEEKEPEELPKEEVVRQQIYCECWRQELKELQKVVFDRSSTTEVEVDLSDNISGSEWSIINFKSEQLTEATDTAKERSQTEKMMLTRDTNLSSTPSIICSCEKLSSDSTCQCLGIPENPKESSDEEKMSTEHFYKEQNAEIYNEDLKDALYEDTYAEEKHVSFDANAKQDDETGFHVKFYGRKDAVRDKKADLNMQKRISRYERGGEESVEEEEGKFGEKEGSTTESEKTQTSVDAKDTKFRISIEGASYDIIGDQEGLEGLEEIRNKSQENDSTTTVKKMYPDVTSDLENSTESLEKNVYFYGEGQYYYQSSFKGLPELAGERTIDQFSMRSLEEDFESIWGEEMEMERGEEREHQKPAIKKREGIPLCCLCRCLVPEGLSCCPCGTTTVVEVFKKESVEIFIQSEDDINYTVEYFETKLPKLKAVDTAVGSEEDLNEEVKMPVKELPPESFLPFSPKPINKFEEAVRPFELTDAYSVKKTEEEINVKCSELLAEAKETLQEIELDQKEETEEERDAADKENLPPICEDIEQIKTDFSDLKLFVPCGIEDWRLTVQKKYREWFFQGPEIKDETYYDIAIEDVSEDEFEIDKDLEQYFEN